MPMIIIGCAILLGWWFPGQYEQQQATIERHVRAAIAEQCGAKSPTPKIRWALPVVEQAFGVATSQWCKWEGDLDKITFSWGQGPEDTHLVSLMSGGGSTIRLIVVVESDDVVMISSVEHDPAGT